MEEKRQGRNKKQEKGKPKAVREEDEEEEEGREKKHAGLLFAQATGEQQFTTYQCPRPMNGEGEETEGRQKRK